MELYDPIDVPKPVGDGLWIVDGPLVRMNVVAGMGPALCTRMVVARLSDGGLWLWSPTELSAQLRDAVDALGPVRHLVSPNKLHYAHIAAWQQAYPEARAWASPGVVARAASQKIAVSFDRELVGPDGGAGGDAQTEPEAPWSGEIDCLVFRGSSFFEEVVFFHRRSRTLLCADLIGNLEPSKLAWGERLLMRAAGMVEPDGKMPLEVRATYRGAGRDVARGGLAKMLAWRPERVVIAHGRWFERDGEQVLRHAFRWLD